MERGNADASTAVGAAVVFTIIGVVIFGIYFFLIVQPANAALASEKDDAIVKVGTLSSIGTSDATSKATEYLAEIQAAGSPTEVASIANQVDGDIRIEEKRRGLLDLVDTAVDGTYYSATGTRDTIQVPALATLSQTLKDAIDTKQTVDDLDAYESTINTDATSAWRTHLTGVLNGLDNSVEMFRKAPGDRYASGGYMSKEAALDNIDGWAWETLRKLKFAPAGSVEVPIMATFGRTPTITAGSNVNLYVYNIATDNVIQEYLNVEVQNVIYSYTDIGTISWSMTDGVTSYSYSTNIWETLKAAAAGDAEAAAVGWSGYGDDLMDRVLAADIGNYNVSAIYVVKVPNEIGPQIAQYEFYQSGTVDVILLPIV